MNIFITGHNGFIAKNLKQMFQKNGHVCFDDPEDLIETPKKEICIHQNSDVVLRQYFENHKIDCIVHNAAVVGTDVVALQPKESCLTNIAGTYNVCTAANNSRIPVCYLGTTVMYDTRYFQCSPIFEDSKINPLTLYGIQKHAGEQIVKATTGNWIIMRPLFAYGGIGDMNSLIAKCLFAAKTGRKRLEMFLDPQKTKDYMHVNDFCSAVVVACEMGLLGCDFNISSSDPRKTDDIVEIISNTCGVDMKKIVKWHPKTDYLGNHILSSEKFRKRTGWESTISLESGIHNAWLSISNDNDTEYNPLKFLEAANAGGINLTQFFPKA